MGRHLQIKKTMSKSSSLKNVKIETLAWPKQFVRQDTNGMENLQLPTLMVIRIPDINQLSTH